MSNPRPYTPHVEAEAEPPDSLFALSLPKGGDDNSFPVLTAFQNLIDR